MEIATAFVAIRPQTDGFESELASALAGGDPVEVPVIAETGDAEAEISSLEGEATVEAVADVGDAEAEIDSIEGGDAEVNVSANTEQAQESIESLTESSGGAAAGLTQVSEAGAAGGAAMGALGIGTLGATAAMGYMVTSGLEAAGALERFTLIAGDNAEALRSIDVGGLSGDIGDLALQIGSSDEAMLNATASFVTFGESTGASSAQIVAASDNINALALRAVALNPSLGDAGEVATRLSTALARGGRATTQFGIGLTSAEINARALADTGKASADELTQFEKAAAGAEIATERLAGTMGDDYAAGAENAALQTAAMKQQLGEAAESIGTLMLPAVMDLTEGITQLAAGAANLDLGSVLAGAWDLTTFGQLQNGLSRLNNMGGDGAFSAAFADAADSMTAAAGPTKVFGDLLGETDAAAGDAAAAISDLDEAISDYVDGIVSVPAAQRDLRQSFADLAEANASGTWNDQAEAMEDVITDTAKLVQNQNALGFSSEQMNATIYGTVGLLNAAHDAGQITDEQFAELTAQILGIPIPDPITTTTNAPETEGQVNSLGGAVGKLPPVTSLLFGNNAPSNQGQVESLGVAAARAAGDYNLNFHISIGDALNTIDTLRNAAASVKSIIEVGGAQGAGLGRPLDTGGGGGTIVVQTRLDGAVIAESVHRHNGYALVSEGYEP